MEPKDFFTRARANAGLRLPLYDPDTGQETEHWIHILGRDSDTFRRAEADSKRRLVEAVKGMDPGNKEAIDSALKKAGDDETLTLIASLVSGWSFDAPCTFEAVKEFLREAPQIADAIDRTAVKRHLFSQGVSTSSTGTPKPNSASTNLSPEGSKQSEPPLTSIGSKRENGL